MKKNNNKILKNKLLFVFNAGKRNNSIVKNFSYLSIIQIFNLLLPLITYPYLIRVLGGTTYGLVVFAQAIVGYLVILVSFGFNFTATKEVSINRGNMDKLGEIVSSVLIIKTALLIISILLLSILLFLIPQAKGFEVLFLVSLWVCLYDVLFPTWYFQGLEKMKYITYITLVSRLIFVALIFLFIRSKKDYLLFPIFSGIGAIIAGIISLIIIFKIHKVKFEFQPIGVLKCYFKQALPLFVSNVSISLYVSTNKVIVGSFLGMKEVAYYDLAEKITSILKMPQFILSQSLFPKISKDLNVEFVKKIFKITLIANTLIYVFLLMSSKYIVLILGGNEMISALLVVNTIALTVPITAISNIFGIQLLIPFGKSKEFSRVIVSSGIIYLLQIVFLYLTIGFNTINISIVTVNTELFVTLYMYYYCKKMNLWK